MNCFLDFSSTHALYQDCEQILRDFCGKSDAAFGSYWFFVGARRQAPRVVKRQSWWDTCWHREWSHSRFCSFHMDDGNTPHTIPPSHAFESISLSFSGGSSQTRPANMFAAGEGITESSSCSSGSYIWGATHGTHPAYCLPKCCRRLE